MKQGRNGPICKALREVHNVDAHEFGTEFIDSSFETWVTYKVNGELVTAQIRTPKLPRKEELLELISNVVYSQRMMRGLPPRLTAAFIEALELETRSA